MTQTSEEILLTSRIRLARNIEGYCFPNKISQEDAKKLQDKIVDIFHRREDTWRLYELNNLSPLEVQYNVEAYQISPRLVEQKNIGSFLTQEEGPITVMLFEEDHLRMQSIRKGMHLQEMYGELAKLNMDLSEELDFSYSDKLGYITACPTNLGTGLRASCMLHLPGLGHFGLEEIAKSLQRLGFVLRGMKGEGTKGLGHVYQISNERTLGLSEEEFIRRAESIVNEIITLEENKRKEFYLDYLIDLEDLAKRSYGILKNARILSYEEAIEHLSHVKLGIDLSVLKAKESFNFYEILISFQKAHLQMERGSYLDKKSENIYRANRARKLMKEVF